MAAISLEEDEEVDRISYWDDNLSPEGELARLAVLPSEQNRGYGRIMLRHGMEELKRRGYKGIHFLVNKYNTKAIRCYEVFGFRVVGEIFMYEQDFLCYENACSIRQWCGKQLDFTLYAQIYEISCWMIILVSSCNEVD